MRVIKYSCNAFTKPSLGYWALQLVVARLQNPSGGFIVVRQKVGLLKTFNYKKMKAKKIFKIISIIILIIICVFIWYISVPIAIVGFIWKKKKFTPKIRIGISIATVIVFSIIGFYLINSNKNISPTISESQNNLTTNRILTDEEKAEQEKTETDAEAKKQAEQEEALKNRLIKELDGIKTFDGSTFRGDLDSLNIEVVGFSVYANLINQNKNNSNPEIKVLVQKIENELVKLQIKEFPLIRKNYVEVVSKNLWIENGEAKYYGTSNKNILLISAIFADNKNIAKMQQSIEPILKKFRFSRVDYKWIDSEYTEYNSYNLDSLKDTDIVGINIPQN